MVYLCEAMIGCLVIGESWAAKAIAKYMGHIAVPPERAKAHLIFEDPLVVIHADTCPTLDSSLGAWEWVLYTLAMRRLFNKSHWIQHSPIEVLSGAARQRPYGAAAEVRPLGFVGQIGAALEWGLRSLDLDFAIVRSGLLYDDAPGHLLRWAVDLVRTGFGQAPSEIVSPTPVDLFAKAIENLAHSRNEGIYHAACQGQASYRDIIRTTATHMEMSTPIVDYYSGPIAPVNLSLTSTTKLGRWQDVYLARLGDLTNPS